MFDSLIKPVFLYGCQVLAPHNDLTKYFIKDTCKENTGETFLTKVARDPYERFHLRYLKWCLSVHQKATNVGCWGETGRYPLHTDAMKMSIDYFVRVKNSETNTLLHAAFTEQHRLKLEWYCNMNTFIDLYGSGPHKSLSLNSRSNMQSIFRAKWKDAKVNSPKLDFYNSIKEDFGIAEYLYIIKNNKHRCALSRLRISAHNLYIERGRYARPTITRENRICLYCKYNANINTVESESHVLDDCSLYKGIRTGILNETQCRTLTDVIVNASNEDHHHILAGKAAHLVLEKHQAFTSYYEDYPVNFLTSTGKFTFL